MGDPVAVMQEMATGIQAEVPTAEVLIGDEFLGDHYGGVPRVVFTAGDGEFRGPRDIGFPDGSARAIYEMRTPIEAHLYVEGTDVTPGAKLTAMFDMIAVIARAVYHAAHGSHGGSGPEITNYTTDRSSHHMRHGEIAVVFIDIGFPIQEGPASVAVAGLEPATATGGDGGGPGEGSFVVNP